MKAVEQLAELFQIPTARIEATLKAHKDDVSRMDTMHNYYKGEHAITTRTAADGQPNNKVVANHAKYISTMLTGYFIGNPPSYVASDESANDAVEFINYLYRKRHVGVHDYTLGKEDSITGLSYELIYVPANDEPDETYGIVLPKLAKLDPRQTMLFEDIDIEQTVRGAMYFVPLNDDEFQVWVYTDTEVYVYLTDDPYEGDYEMYVFEAREGEVAPQNPSPHMFGGAPVIRYDNNEVHQGDFEQVISLIDAYNVLQSDRINDKELFVDSILVILGGKMKGTMKDVRVNKMLEVPTADSNVKWLHKTLNEVEVEQLKNSIKKDIHEFSFTPNLTDENFAGTTSGEAMKFKLFGTEQVLQEKEVYFERGLRLRLKRIFNYLATGKVDEFDAVSVKIGFNHAMPTNLPNPIEIVNQLKGFVSDETLLGLLDFVEDVPGEMSRVAVQKKKASELTRSEFEYPSAAPKAEDKVDVPPTDPEA